MDGGPPEHAQTRRLYREPEERKLTGLCGGLSDYLGADPTVVRLATVLLALSSRAAIVAYLVGAVVVPERPATTPRQRADRQLLPGHWTLHVVGLVVVLVLVGVSDDQWWTDAPLLGLALVALGVWVLFKDRIRPLDAVSVPSTDHVDIHRENANTGSDVRTTLSPEVTPQGDLAGPLAHATSPGVATHKTESGSPPVPVPPGATSSVPDDSALRAGPQGEVPPPVPPWGLGTPPKPRPSSGALVLGLAFLVGGVVSLLALVDAVDVTAEKVLAAVLATIGLALVATAWRGRRGGLVGLGAAVAAALLLVDVVDLPVSGEAGERTVVIDEVRELDDVHEQLAGELVLDLRQLPRRPGRVPTIRAEVGLGNLTVLLPRTLTADVDAQVGLGQLHGSGVEGTEETGVDVDRAFEVEGREGGGRVRLRLQVGLGELEVRHA